MEKNTEQKESRLARLRKWGKEPVSENWHIGILISLLFLVGLFIIYISYQDLFENMENQPTFEERYAQQTEFLREAFGSEINVYPDGSLLNSDLYYLSFPNDEVMIATVWEDGDTFDFEVETLDAPYETKREINQYDGYIDARKYSAEVESTLND